MARTRVRRGLGIRGFGEESGAAENALRAALATIDVADASSLRGADQTGQIRGNRRSELNTIARSSAM